MSLKLFLLDSRYLFNAPISFQIQMYIDVMLCTFYEKIKSQNFPCRLKRYILHSVHRERCRFVIKINSISSYKRIIRISLCESPGFRCAGNKKNHERNSCNKNQSERREKAPRGAPTGRAPRGWATLFLLALHTYTSYNASTLPY